MQGQGQEPELVGMVAKGRARIRPRRLTTFTGYQCVWAWGDASEGKSSGSMPGKAQCKFHYLTPLTSLVYNSIHFPSNANAAPCKLYELRFEQANKRFRSAR